jgi:hypothetical protein
MSRRRFSREQTRARTEARNPRARELVRNARDRQLRRRRSFMARIDAARRRVADQREAGRRKRRSP